MKEPLSKRFESIAKRKTKILDPKKRPKGMKNQDEAVEVQQLQVEEPLVVPCRHPPQKSFLLTLARRAARHPA